MAPAANAPIKAKFEKGEKVLCKHREQLYDAVVKNYNSDKKKPFQIHYQNWSKNWDEWVEEGRILEVNDENRLLQVELKKKVGDKAGPPKGKKKNLFAKPKPRRETPLKGYVFVESSDESKNMPHDNNLEIKISVPSTLNQVLTGDYLFIKDQNLYRLPVKFPISKIMNDFMLTGKDLAEKSCFKEYKGTVQIYFDYALKNRCLYAQERKQYEEMFASKTRPALCYCYGVEHLLRFFMIFPKLLSASKTLEQVHIDETKETTDKFFVYLEANIKTYMN